MMTLPGGQVRSLTLDVRVWEPSVIGYFQSVGNAFANSIWEEGLSIEGSTRHLSSGQSAERCLWNLIPYFVMLLISLRLSLCNDFWLCWFGSRGASNDRGHPAPDIPIVKPDAMDPLPVKEKFIQAKVCTRKKSFACLSVACFVLESLGFRMRNRVDEKISSEFEVEWALMVRRPADHIC